MFILNPSGSLHDYLKFNGGDSVRSLPTKDFDSPLRSWDGSITATFGNTRFRLEPILDRFSSNRVNLGCFKNNYA